MYQHFKEATLPLTYRRREVDCLLNPLTMQRSVRVAGLSGMGKSNLLRFLVSHPQRLEDDPNFLAKSVYFLYLDCNKLNPVNSLSFYRECAFRLSVSQDLPTIADEYLLYKQVETALRQIDPGTLVIWVVDQAEPLYATVSPEFFRQLRNLRDEVRAGKMIFIFGSQRPLGNLFELEKLFNWTCWVGPLSAEDREEFFTRHEKRLGFRVEEALRNLWWQLTGAHPGLLKNALEWTKWRGLADIERDEIQLIRDALHYEPIQKYCRTLWDDLRPAEQNFLAEIGSGRESGTPSHQLKQSGLLRHGWPGWQIFSPLWETYLRQNIWPHLEVQPMQVELNRTTRQVKLHWQGQTVKTIISRNLVFSLLEALSVAPGQLYSKDELINAIYKDELVSAVFDDALFQLIAGLRKSLDPLVNQLCPEMTGSCLQNIRGVGYKLVVDLPAYDFDEAQT